MFVNKKISKFRVDINDTSNELAEMDEKLKIYKQYFNNLGDAPSVSEECLDKFLEFHHDFRSEKDIDTKFWAFISGYLNMRMKQLQDNQYTILNNFVSSFNNHMEQSLKNGQDKTK
jgi:hypothetical protein